MRSISKNYIRICLLDHEHTFSVMYDFRDNTFNISKEEFADPETIEDEWKRIYELLEKETCNFCDSKLQMSELAGFLHDDYNPYDIEEPICNNCWKEHWERIDNKNHYYCSLKKYLLAIDLLGDEELKSCPALFYYPKTVYDNYPLSDRFNNEPLGRISCPPPPELTDLDKDLLNQFIKETDIEWHRNPDEGGTAILNESSPKEKQWLENTKAKCQHEYNPSFNKGKRCVRCCAKIIPWPLEKK